MFQHSKLSWMPKTSCRHKPCRSLSFVVLIACSFLLTSTFAADNRTLVVAPAKNEPTEQRVALVIGNSDYKSSPLRNPANDAEAIAGALRNLGFAVTLKLNQDREGMAKAIREFGNQLKGGGTGLFYYAGHGMQVNGRNFLVPVDANIESEDEVPYRGVDANEVLAKMDSAKNRLNIMILDACRNNPFSRKFRSAAQGLAQMEAPSGTLVSFATAPGSVASDGAGKNGLYTQHLLAHIATPGLPVEQLFKQVRVGVTRETKDKQIPWESSSLKGDFYFKPGPVPGTVPADALSVEVAYWESIKDSTSAEDYKAYLKKYPNGQFADLAKRRAENPPKPVTVASIVPMPLKPQPSPGSIAVKTWVEPATAMEFMWIPKGCYQMGSHESEAGRDSDERRHEVCVEGYWLSKYEVTNSQYRMFRPSHDSGEHVGHALNNGRQPVVRISWQEAMKFAVWLSNKTGKKFRLPTEAEWEYAARAGTQTTYYWGDDRGSACRNANVADQAAKVAFRDWIWAIDCSDSYIVSAPVGSFQPNAYGLYDILGNVREWTASRYEADYGGEELRADLESRDARVVRGGSWDNGLESVRVADRDRATPDNRYYTLGFRLAKTP